MKLNGRQVVQNRPKKKKRTVILPTIHNLWNLLPQDLVMAPCLDGFARGLQKFMVEEKSTMIWLYGSFMFRSSIALAPSC